MDRVIYACKFGLTFALVFSTLRYLLPSPVSIFGSFIFSLSATILTFLVFWFLVGKRKE
ncbi:Uncharacterised protein [Staphylococcus microti]|uniref:Uncharacterized protein n=1 Tax=Staphylococcus microti TaxID=569857 RepID=A0A380GU02_9STAP|nr:hypothetical protein [Staphylococcus microti]SUM57190.1 Uncharacterised protein [Staphylococcus microti]